MKKKPKNRKGGSALEAAINKGLTKHAALNEVEGAGKCPAGGSKRKRAMKGGK